MFFWLSAVGGLAIALSWFYDPHGITAVVGVALFLVGVALFFSRALSESRREGVGLGSAVAKSVRRALRFAWAMMP